ncbi:Putative oxoglutarate/iron-dependent dioxygenase, non-hem dioxygenase domain-containing protein [Colletotrichum destructivum]|uniref:Oxoglutarate/iron-dependent dioxygenase, non-hem dioxygenase domain-containing protein n=1 Tax=Colletotrichum destructivum TaxID=34406 RepID=A0AAX4IBC6_9PEZI|nr:Putative oxoglutarate/iron-dependent dioxygenase, non-hem dioxygenase domain-containing protein [Colletotrichum destructivum]
MGVSTEVPQTVEWAGKRVPIYPMETVDFGRVLSQEPAELEILLRCCQEQGFFYLDLNGLDGSRFLDDQQKTLDLMHRYFESPIEAKNELGLVTAHLGYEPVGSRTGGLPNTRDGYEMFKVSRDEIQRKDPKFPKILQNDTDKAILKNAISGSNIVTKAVLSGLSSAMGLVGAARYENAHRNDRPSTSTLAMMHYVPADPVKDKEIGHQKHTDISSLTLLFAEEWGLQIRPPGTKEFGFVAPKKGCAIINVGDSLRFASGHTMMSCIHRVVPFNPEEHRYSIAYFLRAENETMFTDSEGRYVTAGQWHDEKFFLFKATPDVQALAPPSMLYGGMTADEEWTPYAQSVAKAHASEVPAEGPKQAPVVKENLVKAH